MHLTLNIHKTDKNIFRNIHSLQRIMENSSAFLTLDKRRYRQTLIFKYFIVNNFKYRDIKPINYVHFQFYRIALSYINNESSQHKYLKIKLVKTI